MIITYKVLGLMSGTSLDGLDIAYCIFNYNGQKWSFEMDKTTTIKYSEEWIYKLSNADQLNAYEFVSLNNEYGYFLGEESKKFIEKHQIQVDFIASHGHTVFHQPSNKITFQLGSAECIAAASEQNVISDFRTLDVAFGGQGAPLVPIGDSLLFADYDYCVNLGGFANISYQFKNERVAYDICPVNIVLNIFAQELGFPFDDKGKMSEQGTVNQCLLNELENIEYYQRNFPKSLGKEWLLKEFLPIIDKYNISINDKLRTVSEHIVCQILNATKTSNNLKILFTGGGTYNDFIVHKVIDKSSHTIIIPQSNIIDFKEALIFAFLGVLRYRGEVNCLKSVTGAINNNIGGKLTLVK
jgi:anhydro-N-acetylmuramic acid kinase